MAFRSASFRARSSFSASETIGILSRAIKFASAVCGCVGSAGASSTELEASAPDDMVAAASALAVAAVVVVFSVASSFACDRPSTAAVEPGGTPSSAATVGRPVTEPDALLPKILAFRSSSDAVGERFSRLVVMAGLAGGTSDALMLVSAVGDAAARSLLLLSMLLR